LLAGCLPLRTDGILRVGGAELDEHVVDSFLVGR
jgi:hypothetical protein